MKIDFVVSWLNPADSVWLDEFSRYRMKWVEKGYVIPDHSDKAFRDLELMKYWFRGVENNANWVNRVHFITSGHLPYWLNRDHPKLSIVKHSEYIAKKYLPTFNSRVIENNILNITGLAEKFVLFNDDFFLINNVSETDFFKYDFPVDAAVQNVITPGGISHTILNNVGCMNKEFEKHTTILSNFSKWFNINYGLLNLRNVALLPWRQFTGFWDPHLPQPYTLANFEACWSKFGHELTQTNVSQFKTALDINHYLFRYHHLCSGTFSPGDIANFGDFIGLSESSLDEVVKKIATSRKKCIVINDNVQSNYTQIKMKIKSVFETKYPNKSRFEI